MAKRISTDPVVWIQSALGDIFSTLLLFHFSFLYGLFAVGEWDPFFLWGGPLIILATSILMGWGLLFAPVFIIVFWALLQQEGNVYVILSVNALCAALLYSSFSLFDGWIEFRWVSILLLMLPAAVLFMAGYQPARRLHQQWKLRKFKGIHIDPEE